MIWGRSLTTGKRSRNFYVEGLDLTNGKYKQISENLRADAVQNIQVMENHQPIRVLQRKIKTEDVALNLKLRPEFPGSLADQCRRRSRRIPVLMERSR